MKGENGNAGKPGSMSLTGPKEAQGHKGIKGDKEDRNGGTVYVRLGHNQHPSTAQLVYGGRVEGLHYEQSGGGSNHQCLPLDPNYISIHGGSQENIAYSYVWSRICNTLLPSLFIIMMWYVQFAMSINGLQFYKYTCPKGCTKEYYGYLMAEHFDRSQS